MTDQEHEKRRDRYFANEAFIIGMLQAVAGGSAVAAIAQIETLLGLVPPVVVMLYLTLLIVALGAAVLAATWRYFYSMWTMKAPVTKSKGEEERAAKRSADATRDLGEMRKAIPISATALLLAYVCLLAPMWYSLLTRP